MKKLKEAKTLTGVRLEQSLINDLKTIANKKERTFSNLVRIILKNYIEQEKNLS